jgi:hypothetical protein
VEAVTVSLSKSLVDEHERTVENERLHLAAVAEVT